MFLSLATSCVKIMRGAACAFFVAAKRKRVEGVREREALHDVVNR